MPEGRVPFSEGRVTVIRGARTRLPWDESLFSAERVPVCRVTGPPFPRHGNPCPRDCYALFRGTRASLPRVAGPVYECRAPVLPWIRTPFTGDGYPFIVWRVTDFPMDGYPFPEGRVPHSRGMGIAVPRTDTPIAVEGFSPFPRDVYPTTAGLWLLFPRERGPFSDERDPFSE